MDWSHLLSPFSINGMALRNRVVMPGMDMNRCVDGEMTRAEIDHYAARAAGGCGLVLSGASAITFPVGAASHREAGLGEDRFLPGLTALAGAVHSHGGKMGMQLVHHGKVAGVDTSAGRPLLVPSLFDDKLDLGALVDNPMDELMKLATATHGKSPTYRVATTDDIAEVIERFADAAARVQRAGIDAVEVHGAHGYLINTFLSRAYNTRDDEYGGSLENRCRLLVEVITAVRERVGPDYPILVRLNGCEYGIENGITPEETAATAVIAAAAGADAIHVSANAANAFKDFTKGPLPAEVGQYREMAALVKRSVDVPVIAVGRLLPELAEEMLANGECDLVAMGRQQLADSQLVNKIAAGRRASVRPCVNCYVCVEQNFFDGSAICAVNPALGNEAATAEQTATTAASKHVVVIGGGPGGLETARIAAQRGHRVTLLERADRLGGATWFAELSTSPNAALVEWLTHEVTAAGVDVRCGIEATVTNVAALSPDVVVVATGAVAPDMPAVRAFAETVATHSDRQPPNVTVVGGDMIGLSVATFAAEHGAHVDVLEPSPQLGAGMAMPRRWAAVRKAADLGIGLTRGASADAIATRGSEADAVVLVANGWQAGSALADELRGAGFDVHVVGDAAAIGHIHGAMHGAHAVATRL